MDRGWRIVEYRATLQSVLLAFNRNLRFPIQKDPNALLGIGLFDRLAGSVNVSSEIHLSIEPALGCVSGPGDGRKAGASGRRRARDEMGG